MDDCDLRCFFAVHANDSQTIQQLIDNEYELIHQLNEDGKSALQIALEVGNYEIAKLLLENGIKVNTTLLRMIEVRNTTAVSFICKHNDILKEHSQNMFDNLPENDEYRMETTPLTLAAEKNSYQIVKILLSNGAQMPSFEALRSRSHGLPTIQLTSLFYGYYRTITSEAYLLQTKGNLLTDVFNIFKQIKRVQRKKKGMNDEFATLRENLELVPTKMLDLTRNNDEVRYLLAGEAQGRSLTSGRRCQQNTIPPVIREALLLNLKKFMSHDKCQAVLTDLWYEDFFIDIKQSILTRSVVAALLMCLYPFLCILYIICPCGPIRRLMKAPFVKFVLHLASRLTFLGLLIYSTVITLVIEQDEDSYKTANLTDQEIRDSYLSYRAANKMGLLKNVCILIWIVGTTCREMSDVRRFGCKMYLKIICSTVDIVQLLLYWIFIIASIVVTVQAYQTIYEPGWIAEIRKEIQPTTLSPAFPTTSSSVFTEPESSTPTMSPQTQSTTIFNSPCNYTDDRINNRDYDQQSSPGGAFFNDIPVLVTFFGESRYDWSAYDSLLVAEAAFALANVLTFVRLLHSVVLVSGRLGVLQISLIGMVGDIVKFFILFFMIWISFSLGLTQLYRPFEELKLAQCIKIYLYEDCPTPAFQSLLYSMKTLFWALFGMNDLQNLALPDELYFTEVVGNVLYSLYLLVCATVLLNALIAMMSNTYGRVENKTRQETKKTEPLDDPYQVTNQAITRRYIHHLERRATHARLATFHTGSNPNIFEERPL